MVEEKEIIEAIAKHLGVTPVDIDLNATFAEDLGLSPIEMADLLAEVAEKFNVTVDPQEAEGIRTVHDLVVVIEDLSLE